MAVLNPGGPNLTSALALLPDLSSFSGAFAAIPSLLRLIQSPDLAITIFAPTNEAFAKLPPSVIAYLADPANGFAAYALLVYQVVKVVNTYSAALAAIQGAGGKGVVLPSGFEFSTPDGSISAFNIVFSLNK